MSTEKADGLVEFRKTIRRIFDIFWSGALWGLALMFVLSACGVEHWGYWPRWFWIGVGFTYLRAFARPEVTR